MEKEKSVTSLEQQEEHASRVARKGDAESMGLTQIQKLVYLLDRSDIAEIELNRSGEGLHLVLRKLKTLTRSAQVSEVQPVDANKHIAPANKPGNPLVPPELHCLKSQMVGVFHPWLKSPGKTLVAVGDLVKVDQIVGTIEMLAILNEVKATVAGRVIEVCIQDGQSVEYGQVLVTIDSSGC